MCGLPQRPGVIDNVVVALVVVVCSQQGRARGDSVSGHFPTRFFFRLI